MTNTRSWLLALLVCSSPLAAQAPPIVASGPPSAAPNALSAAERAAGWRLLFDGKTLDGWRGLGYDSVPRAHWVVVDGPIQKIANVRLPRLPDGQPAHGGDPIAPPPLRHF